MNAEPRFFDQIDDFLAGKLSEADRAEMEKAISAHADLAKEVSLRKLEFEVAESLIAADIRAQFTRLQQSSAAPPSNAPVVSTVKKRIIIGVFLLGIIALLFWLASFLNQQNNNAPVPPPIQDVPVVESDTLKPVKNEGPAPVAPKQEKPEPMASGYPKRLAMAQEAYTRPDFGQMRGSAAAPDSFDILLDAWQKRDYQSVITAAANIKNTSPSFIKSRYMLAHAYFLSRNYGQAAAVFGQVADSGMMPYSEEAEWYIVPALMSQKNVDQSALRKRMEYILKNPDHAYFAECKKLAEKAQ